MPHRVALTIAMAVTAVLVNASAAAADPGDWGSGDSDSDTGEIEASAGQEVTGGAGESSSKPRCWYQVAEVDVIDADGSVGADLEYTRPNPVTGVPETLYVRHCPE